MIIHGIFNNLESSLEQKAYFWDTISHHLQEIHGNIFSHFCTMKFSLICLLSSQKYLLDSFMRIRLRGVKRLLFSPQYIEQQISIFNETNCQMKERKSIIYSLIKVAHSFKNSLNTVFLPIFGLLGACFTLINVNCVKNAIFENYFEQFSHFSTV